MKKTIKTTPSFTPRCPECSSELEGCGFPLPRKGRGKCPAAGYYDFEVEVDDATVVKDKDGNVVKKVGWSLTSIDDTKHPK